MIEADTLAAARQALDRHAWTEAYELLSKADLEGPLTPEDLERLGQAAWWIGRMDDCIDARGRAFAGYMAAGETLKAGFVSLRLTEDHFYRLESSIGRGWLAQGERLLSDDQESVEFGWLARVRAVLAFEREGNLDRALEWAETAFRIASEAGDRDLYALSLHDKGRFIVAQGRIDEGMALMEESMVAAISEELGALVTGRIYCNMIDICEKLADYERAAEWDEAAGRWCERVGNMSGFPGICRVRRAEIMLLRGKWPEAQLEAEKATRELSDFLTFAGVGFKEIGEVRLRTGDLSGAEEAFRKANELGQSPLPGLALLHLAQGEQQTARELITQALTDESLIELERAKLLPALVEVALAEGDSEMAEEAVRELEGIAQSFGSKALWAAVAFAEGSVALSHRNAEGAVEQTKRAWKLFNEIDLPYEAARARLQLGLAYREQGASAPATMELEAARKAFEGLGATLEPRYIAELMEGPGPIRTEWAMMFTDIVGSTDLIETIGDEAWAHLVAWHDRTLRSLFDGHGGREQDRAGDGFFTVFPSPSAAVECAVDIQRTLQRHRAEAGFAPQVRIGVHLAEVNETPRELSGLEIHKAARIGNLAAGGEVVISAELAAQLDESFSVSQPKAVTVKGVVEPVTVMNVGW